MNTFKVPGLTIGSDQDVYSSGYGYISFVKGKHEDDKEEDPSANEEDEPDARMSSLKESRIASKYRHLIYHPFIDHVRITRYNWDSINEPDIPRYLTAVSWMDGANGQLKRITCQKNIEFEGKRRVVCCKHSDSRTAVEQAADTGPMFKAIMLIKEMDSPNATVNHIYHHIDKELKKLQESGLLVLSTHKRKAVLCTIPKLPSVTGRSHSLSNVRKAFVLNGQLDLDSMLVPSFDNLLHTYRGDITKTCLANKEWLLAKFYKEM